MRDGVRFWLLVLSLKAQGRIMHRTGKFWVTLIAEVGSLSYRVSEKNNSNYPQGRLVDTNPPLIRTPPPRLGQCADKMLTRKLADLRTWTRHAQMPEYLTSLCERHTRMICPEALPRLLILRKTLEVLFNRSFEVLEGPAQDLLYRSS